jgi:hypothetical protein
MGDRWGTDGERERERERDLPSSPRIFDLLKKERGEKKERERQKKKS